MLIQTLTKGPEKVFVVVHATEAITAGQIVSFSLDGTNDGLDAEPCDTAVLSNSVVGAADNAISSGDYGLVQVYGIHDAVKVNSGGTATNANRALGDNLSPGSSGSGGLGGGNGGIAAASGGIGSANAWPGFVAAVSSASSAAAVSQTTKVFIRTL